MCPTLVLVNLCDVCVDEPRVYLVDVTQNNRHYHPFKELSKEFAQS